STLTSLAWPGLCCCSLRAAPSHASARLAPDAPHRSCCHRETKPSETAPRVPPAEAPCPCKEGQAGMSAVPAALAEPVEHSFPTSLTGGPVALLPVIALATEGGDAPGRDHSPGPPRTARDLLRAFHI